MCNKVFYQYSCGHSTVTVYECNRHSADDADRTCKHNSWHMTPLEEICYVCDMPGPPSPRSPSSRMSFSSSSSSSSSFLRVSPPRPSSSSPSSSPPSLSRLRLGSETSSETVLVRRPKQPLDADADADADFPPPTSIFSTERLTRSEEVCAAYEDFRTVVRGEELVDVVPLRTRKLVNARADPPPGQIARLFDMLSRAPQLVPGNT
ncbi:uncharacterized protein E0L32_008973 [Thyridium curvatum]|uniref:Uncharacterized protein n=1 Tax=Thyridium curvatum TaxID=1093900 RepID=A0A507AJX5_9PEZI|nr:uncharacterized protein E0L32_008973 [Thyridium curvatum]TPX09782.1 hypothetical protein E0L32_008973 [Thyridium curvatum]